MEGSRIDRIPHPLGFLDDGLPLLSVEEAGGWILLLTDKGCLDELSSMDVLLWLLWG
jgi:hypothetical protein